MKQSLVLHAGQVGKKRLQAALTAVLIIHNVRPFPRPYSHLRTLRRTGKSPEEWSAKSKKKPDLTGKRSETALGDASFPRNGFPVWEARLNEVHVPFARRVRFQTAGLHAHPLAACRQLFGYIQSVIVLEEPKIFVSVLKTEWSWFLLFFKDTVVHVKSSVEFF